MQQSFCRIDTMFYASGPQTMNKNAKTDEGMYNLHIYYTSLREQTTAEKMNVQEEDTGRERQT